MTNFNRKLFLSALAGTFMIAKMAGALPGNLQKGQCLPWALAYSAAHPGTTMVICSEPMNGCDNHCMAHAFVKTADGWLRDNMGRSVPAIGTDPRQWYCDILHVPTNDVRRRGKVKVLSANPSKEITDRLLAQEQHYAAGTGWR
jgi:hypothetical protein